MPRAYIFRFIQHRHRNGWAVLDTATNVMFGKYPSESSAIKAALSANARHGMRHETRREFETLPLI